jgi:NAD(P) transhydrogenase subunit alpha
MTTNNGVIIIGTTNLPGELSATASMLYSNNMTNFLTTLVRDGSLVLDLGDDVLVGAPEGDELHVPGMGGVLLCSDGEIHPNQSRLAEVVD